MWVKNFLSERVQQVKVNSSLSSWYEVQSGVVQGSVPGRILYDMRYLHKPYV